MSDLRRRIERFIAETRRRNVVRVAAAYLGSALLVLNFADHLKSGGMLEAGIYQALVTGAGVLFPVALGLAWTFEFTDDGPRKTRPVPAEDVRRWSRSLRQPPERRSAGRTVRTVLLVALVFLGGGWTVMRVSGKSARAMPIPGGTILGGGVPARLSFPETGEGADVDGPVTLRFDDPLDTRTATGAALELQGPRGGRVPATVQASADLRVVRIVPEDSLAFGAEYAVRITPELEALGGGPVVAEPRLIGRFRTRPAPADGDPPAVAASRPADGARGVDPGMVPEVSFSEPVAVGSVDSASVRLVRRSSGETIPYERQWLGAGRTLRLHPAERLAGGSEYALVLDSSVTDGAGNPLAPDTLVFRTRPLRRASTASAGAEEAEPGVLLVRPEPRSRWGRVAVLVDGEHRGAPPVRVTGLAPGGEHVVLIRGVSPHSNWHLPLHRTETRVPAGDSVVVSPRVPGFGEISVYSEPSGVVYVDGDSLGVSPVGNHPVRAGFRTLEVRPHPADSAEHGPYRKTFRIEDGGFQPFRVDLPPPGRGESRRPAAAGQ